MFLGFSVTSIFTSQRGFVRTPWTPVPPPPPLLRVWIHLQHICARYSRSRIYGGPQLSREKQKPHGNNKIPHEEIKYFTAKSKIALVLQWVFAFAVRYLVFAVKYLVLPWGLWFCSEVFGFAVRFLFLPWGFRFCREVFCFCREVFGFAWGFWFCRDSWGPP